MDIANANMSRDADFDKWWRNEPVGEFSGIDAGHVERAFAAGRKAENKASADRIEAITAERDELRRFVLAQQARIAELREALSFYHITNDDGTVADKALTNSDDLSALAAHDAEVRRKVFKEILEQGLGLC